MMKKVDKHEKGRENPWQSELDCWDRSLRDSNRKKVCGGVVGSILDISYVRDLRGCITSLLEYAIKTYIYGCTNQHSYRVWSLAFE